MKRILLAFVLTALAFLLLLNVRLHRPGGPETVHAQLTYLEGAVGRGAPEEMQRLFPEGYVFTWALYGLSSAQLASQLGPQDPHRAHLLAETRRAMRAVDSDEARSIFDPDMDPPYGVFYASWRLYLLAEYVRASGPENLPRSVIDEFTRQADGFARALAASDNPFLESYPEQVWPADTSVGIAALGIYDVVIGPRYPHVIRRWVSNARKRLDSRLGALTHEAEPGTGRPAGGVRGESLALMSRVLVDADREFAREQYMLLRKHFFDDVLGVPGVREYPHGAEGKGDVDTGPLVFGFSGPAVVVGAAAARVHGDVAVADDILGAVEVVGFPVEFLGRRVYAGGKLPVGDAFIAWARSSPVRPPGPQKWEPVSSWTAVYFHVLSAVLAGLLLWWAFRIARRPRPAGVLAAHSNR